MLAVVATHNVARPWDCERTHRHEKRMQRTLALLVIRPERETRTTIVEFRARSGTSFAMIVAN
jgi:hypothetical protein